MVSLVTNPYSEAIQKPKQSWTKDSSITQEIPRDLGALSEEEMELKTQLELRSS